ncbi:hypothetical protein ABZP36_030147 [Zizania latifolia]
MGRSPCCDERGLKKGPWTPEEDEKLLQYIQKNGHGSWRTLPRLAGTVNQSTSAAAEHLLTSKTPPWSAIATHLPGRTDNEIKNFWNTHLKKRLIQMGFDPMTHRPRTDFFAALPQLIALASLREQLAAAAAAADPSASAAASQVLQGGGADHVAIQAAKLQYLQCLLQSAGDTIASAGAGAIGVSAHDAAAALRAADWDCSSPQGTPPGSAVPTPTSGGHHSGLMPCTFSEVPVTSDDVEANQLGLLDCGAAEGFACHGGSLPPLADLSDVANLVDGCSATASSSFCGGASSPFAWPEFFPDDPFTTDFL